MNNDTITICGMKCPWLMKRGQVLRLMGRLNAGGRRVFDKWTKGDQPLLPDERPAKASQAHYRRSDVLRAIQPGDGRLP